MDRRRLTRLTAVLGSIVVFLTASPRRGGTAAPLPSDASVLRPNIVLVTVDTLRADRLGSYGYDRDTTPHLDGLLEAGARFSRARAVEPLTNPSLCSMMTSMYPQEHGASRNGLRMRSGLASLPKALEDYGYATAAFVGNWTLRTKLSGLGEHFDEYTEILNRKRWLGFLRREATAEDLTDAAIEWAERRSGDTPFLLWVHYVEPHAPYRLHEEFVEPLGLPQSEKGAPGDRYDTEVAFVDQQIGRLLRRLEHVLPEPPLVVFASDHGESLGEHDYWGHGRNLYEPGLWIPMGLSWPGHVRGGVVVSAPAMNIDLAPTILGLLEVPAPDSFEGFDWTLVLEGGEAPVGRITHYQAHRGAVLSKHESELARRKGLLAVAVIDGAMKEVWRLDDDTYEVWNLESDPHESHNLAESGAVSSPELRGWVDVVSAGLSALDELPAEPLDEISASHLRDLGYVD
jgi:arylsulfatase A-like enzyme